MFKIIKSTILNFEKRIEYYAMNDGDYFKNIYY